MNSKSFIKRTFGALLTVLGVFCVGYILFYWIKNPALTYMQLFFKYWWLYFIGLFLAIVGVNL